MSDPGIIEQAQELQQDEPEEPPFIQNRVFLNHVDEFNGRHIAEYLTDYNYGALKAARETELGGEGGEEEGEEPLKKRVESPIVGNRYEIIGTKKHPFGVKSEDILNTISDNDIDYFIKEVLNCGFVIYDITKDRREAVKALAVLSAIENEILEVKKIGPKTFKFYDRVFVFILITNVLSWAKTKPIDPEDPTVAFNETDYRKRKAHPNYLDQIACEKEILTKAKLYKDNLKVYIVCSGIIYGYEEDELMFYFKMAWQNEKLLPVFLPGVNTIPLIHIRDLAQILHAIMEFVPNKPRYIFAIEQTQCTQKQFVKAISKCLGRGRLVDVSKEEAFLFNDLKQDMYDRFTLNLKMEPAFIIDDLGVQFKSDLNFAENMKAIVAEFKEWRSLFPKKVIIHGPPASGKTTLAKRIAEEYGLHYVNIKTMIEEISNDLKERIDAEIARRDELKANPKVKEEEEVDEEGGEEEEEEVVNTEELWEKLRDIEVGLENGENGKLPDEQVIRLLRTFLKENICQNQGYVLDGYPKTIEQVKELFGMETEGAGEGGGGEEEEEEGAGGAKVSVMPTAVISLKASDEFLCERVMNLPEKEVQGTHYTEENMLRRLSEFRQNNTEDNTMLDFFDENEIHPHIIAVDELDVTRDLIYEMVQEILASPIGFEQTPEQKEELMRCQEAADKLKEEQKEIQKKLMEEEALEEYQMKMEEKIRILEYLQAEEEKLLTAQCEPLRNYLMKHVFPTLTEGLLEVARIKPRDPVDYLAEFLFKTNPEGKMFNPAYTRQGELISRLVGRMSTTKR